ncbi:MAG: ATP-binding cassette domain-containing protein [Bacteroidetes bacterium]|nr:ATP-binding cassette domain-containing protein [Bacteroidota bacterium]
MFKKLKYRLFTFGLGAILPIVFVILWHFGVKTEILPPALIASPEKVLSKFVLLITNDTLLHNVHVSLFRLFAGFFLGSFMGIILGILVGISKPTSKIVEPLFLFLIPVPPLAWIPLLIITFGIDQGTKIALLTIGSFCALFLTTSFSVKSTDKNLLELSTLYSKGFFVKLFKIILPFSISSIIGSLRIAMALSWTLLMASELIASSAGIGWFIWDSRNFSRADDMIVGMLTVGILGWFSDNAIVLLGNYFNRWKIGKKENGVFKALLLKIWNKLPLKNNWRKLVVFNKQVTKLSDFVVDKINTLLSRKKIKFDSTMNQVFIPIIDVNIIEKKFQLNVGELKVLSELSFKINSGDFISIIGPSGCGKSTLLKLISGLDTDYNGIIINDNSKVIGTSLKRCIVFQEQRLLPWLTISDNIAFALPRTMKRIEKRKRTFEVIELVGLTGFKNVWPSQLSGGMLQRVALARAMVNMPEVLLLDEPFGALDSITRDKMQKELKKILFNEKTKEKNTVIMVTHDIDEAIMMSDKVIVLGNKPTSIKKTITVNKTDSHNKTSSSFIAIRNELINELYE